MRMGQGAAVLLCSLFAGMACRPKPNTYSWKTMTVTVSAYNSVTWQTDSLKDIAAWGDTLRPGMKCIAVSADLLKKGLVRNTPVKIEGLPGIYLVKDRMHPRMRNKIDIYMGADIREARAWGSKRLEIQYPVKKDSTRATQGKQGMH